MSTMKGSNMKRTKQSREGGEKTPTQLSRTGIVNPSHEKLDELDPVSSPPASSPQKKALKVNFRDKTETNLGTTERLKNQEEWRKKMNRPVPNERKYKNFVSQWTKEKKFYIEEMKKSEDDLVQLFVQELGIDALQGETLKYLFDKYRLLRELQMRLRNMDCLRMFRVFLGTEGVNFALDMLRFVENDTIFMNFVDKEDYMIRGISAADKETILKNIDLDPDNDEECDKWVSYILFLSNPATEWLRSKAKWEKTYFKFIDTGMVQSMVNNDTDCVWQLIRWKLPESFMSHADSRLSGVVRADRNFSSYRKNSCPDNCDGHRGKLFLLMIRLRHSAMVDIALQQGISIASQCCCGNIRSMYWDEDKGHKKLDKGADGGSDGPVSKNAEKGAEKQPQKTKTRAKVALRAEFEYETPLSTAAEVGDLHIVKKLVDGGANPLQCNDAAIRAVVKTVITREKAAQAKKKAVLINVVSDEEFIFNLILHNAKEQLRKSNRNQKGLVPPNYCTIVLIYQAVVQELWEAEEVLTKVKNVRNKTLPGDDNNLAQLEPSDGTANGSQENGIGGIGRAESKERITLIGGGSSTKLPVKLDKSVSDGTLKSKKFMGMTIARGKNGSKNNISPPGAGNTLSSRRKNGRKGSVTSVKSSSMASLRSNMVGVGSKGESITVDDMPEELCFVVVTVIDKLLEEMCRENVVSHAKFLNGIIALLEKYKLYLDEDRFQCILKATVNALKDPKVGIFAAAQHVFNNSQIRNYLNFDIDNSWEKRNISLFIKNDLPKKLLKQGQRMAKQRSKLNGAEETKESMLEMILLHASRLGLAWLIVDLHDHGVEPDKNFLKDAVIAATEEEHIEAIEVLIRNYGKQHLKFAFDVALSHSHIHAIQKILQLDNDMTDSGYSLVESYIGKNLVKTESAKHSSLTKNMDSERLAAAKPAEATDEAKDKKDKKSKKGKKEKNKPDKAEENEGLAQPVEELEDDETHDIDPPPVEVVLDFFFVCTHISEDKILKILGDCLESGKPINFSAVAHLLVKANELYPALIPKTLLATYIGTKPVQYDDKPENLQIQWLQLLLDLYKGAVNSGDETVEKEFNDKVIQLLELKAAHFEKHINYESDAEATGVAAPTGGSNRGGVWVEESELL